VPARSVQTGLSVFVANAFLYQSQNYQQSAFYNLKLVSILFIALRQNNINMSLEEKINADLKAAMMAKDEAGLRGIRAIKSAILLAKTEKGTTGVITPEKEVQMLQKMVKQRRDSITEFEKANRQDLITKEKEEVAIIEKYLPAMMSEDDVREVIKKIIAETGASTQKEMGKVMGAASKQLAGKADNKLVADIVKSLLV
jgi:uncharacterized protein YqeY